MKNKELHRLYDKVNAEMWEVIHTSYGKTISTIALGRFIEERVRKIFDEWKDE